MHARSLAQLVSLDPVERDNQIYYFEIAAGRWMGRFSFRIVDKVAFKRAALGEANRLLARLLHLSNRLLGTARIVSKIVGYPDEGEAGVMRSRVWIRKLGLTLYAMRGEYVLDADGRGVDVTMHERFGPVPFLFRNTKRATAVIFAHGLRSRYRMPLMGAEWTGNYEVSDDRQWLVAVYTCEWGRAVETISQARRD